MREFFYRLSWDKEFRLRSLIVSVCSLFCLCLICGCVLLAVRYGPAIFADKSTEEAQDEADENLYKLKFKDTEQENKEDTDKDKSEDNRSDNKGTTSNDSANPESGFSQQRNLETNKEEQNKEQHYHQWNKVVDSNAWTEYIQVQTGTQYKCNNCGYLTSSASTISSHCSRLSHSFSSVPIYETRTVFHPEIYHYECSCGARK